MTSDVRTSDQRVREQTRARSAVPTGSAQDDARVFVAVDSGEDQGDGTTIVACRVADVVAEAAEGGAVEVEVEDLSPTTDVIVVGENLQLVAGDLLLARRVLGDWHAIHRPPCPSPRDITIRVTSGGLAAPGRTVRITHLGATVKTGVTNAQGRVFAQVSYPTSHVAEVLDSSGSVVASSTFAVSCDADEVEVVIAL